MWKISFFLAWKVISLQWFCSRNPHLTLEEKPHCKKNWREKHGYLKGIVGNLTWHPLYGSNMCKPHSKAKELKFLQRMQISEKGLKIGPRETNVERRSKTKQKFQQTAL